MNGKVKAALFASLVAVVIAALELVAMSRPPPPGIERMKEVAKKADAALKSDPSVAEGYGQEKDVTIESLAATRLVGLTLWAKRSAADTVELYLERGWRPNDAAVDLGKTSRALRKIAQAQAFARATLGVAERGWAGAAADVLYGPAQWAALVMLMLVSASRLPAKLRPFPNSSAVRGALANAVLFVGTIGFLFGVFGALSESASEAGLRTGLMRSLHPIVVAVGCWFAMVIGWPEPSTVAAGPGGHAGVGVANAGIGGQVAAAGPAARPAPDAGGPDAALPAQPLDAPPANAGHDGPRADADAIRDAVKRGFLEATLVIVRGLRGQGRRVE